MAAPGADGPRSSIRARKSDRTRNPNPRLVSGYVRSSSAAMMLASSCACAIETPGLSRPFTNTDRMPLLSRTSGGLPASRSVIASGT